MIFTLLFSLLDSCECFEGYTGFDCFKRQCPFGSPWTGFAVADDDIRSIPTECSSRGRCNRDSGRCECEPAFFGHACNQLRVGCGLSNACNGHGQCVSMKQVAEMRNDYNLFYTASYTTNWDAKRIFGCVCDYGFTGVDCQQVLCAYGDDPVTTGQLDEVQALSCLCPSGCAGTFTLSFRGETTRPLVVQSETELTLQAALEALSTIRGVQVAFDGGTQLCDADGVSTLITFVYEHGDVPALVVDAALITGATSPLTIQTSTSHSRQLPKLCGALLV